MCKYRSEDDADDYAEPSFLKVDHKELLTDYGLATKDKQSAPARGFFDSVEDKRDILSDHNHYKVEVKRSNFVTLFLDELAVDRFVACHLYGYAAREIDLNLSHDECSGLQESLLNLTPNKRLSRSKRVVVKEEVLPKKLTNFETYIALIKGYCAILILLLPKGF
jgi:hypothetical protein